MQRFYLPVDLSVDYTITDEDFIHQLTRVLRVKVGERIILFNGDLSETTYEIMSLEKKRIYLRGISRSSPEREAKKHITLLQAIPNKPEKIEYIIQKGVEVGIARFLFFRSDYSQKIHLSPSKIVRFSLIAREALEQCGGLSMPEIHFLDHYPDMKDYPESYVLDTIGNENPNGDYGERQSYTLWVGPEGGWSESERDKMRENSFIFVRFGERVLRTETASSVVAFSLLYA